MSNRFHTKWHRRNHHTYGNSSNPDASFDPIASPEQPFLGDFSIQGSISAVAPLSAYGIYVFTDYTALCAFAGTRAGYFYSYGPMGIEVYGSTYQAISAYAPFIGLKVGSNIRAISAFGGVIGGEFYSPQYALSAYGGNIGINVGSPNIALSAWGNNIGAVISSNTVALSTSGFSEPFPNPSQPYFGPAYVSKNVLNNRTGIFTENPLSAFHVTGGTLLDGHCTITGNLSVLRDFTYLDTYVYITSATQIVLQNNSNESPALLVSNTGENYVMQVFDGGGTTMSGASPSGYPALIVDGHSSRPGYVGLGTLLPNNPLTVVGTISGSQRLQIGYNATASGLYSSVAGGQNNTASGSFSNVAGGCANNASGIYSNVAGGYCNNASGPFSNVAGGGSNNASGGNSNVAGGYGNNASGGNSNVAGGYCNNASGYLSNVAGGTGNIASGNCSSVAGGSSNNTNNQANTFILGSNLKAPLSNYTYVNNISAAGYSCNQYSVTDSTFNNRITTKGNDKTLAVQNSTTVSGYVSIQNLYNGVSASTDVSIFNNNGAYVDLGINSTGYNGYLYSSVFNIASANDAYLFSNASTNNLAIGTANTSDLVFFTGGTLSGVKVAGGNEAMRIKNSGNVGIGISNPNTTLTVNGSISSISLSSVNITSNTLTLNGNLSSSGNMFMNGNVGINTTTPNARLTVVGDISATGGYVYSESTSFARGVQSYTFTSSAINLYASSNFILFTVPSGYRFIPDFFQILIIDTVGTTGSPTSTLKLVRSTDSNALTNSLLIDNTAIKYGSFTIANNNSTAVRRYTAGNEQVLLNNNITSVTPASNYWSTLSAVAVVKGNLIPNNIFV